MALPIIGADERLAQRKGIKGVIFGRSGIGKTSLLWTLNASTTLFLDLEAGDLAVEGLEIDTLRPRTWKECRDFAVFIGGPNPALREDQPYSQAHFDEVCGRYGDPAVIGKYETVFIDWPDPIGWSGFNLSSCSALGLLPGQMTVLLRLLAQAR